MCCLIVIFILLKSYFPSGQEIHRYRIVKFLVLVVSFLVSMCDVFLVVNKDV